MKFKIGDKVVIKGNNTCHGFKVGETVEITKLFPEEKYIHYECANNKRAWVVSEENLEEENKTSTKRRKQ